MKKPIKIAITGATGNISYSVIFRLIAAEAFGKNQQISLNLCDLPGTEKVMEGIAMEVQDCSSEVIESISITSSTDEAFKDADYVLLIGALPRGPGMERADLLKRNGEIFYHQGQSLNKVADPDVKVLVVGNPCNTNCLVAMKQAHRLKPENFHALMRLDENRAYALLANKLKVRPQELQRLIIWGNHSLTQVPDCSQVLLKGHELSSSQLDPIWLEKEFRPSVQKRGAQVISSLGRSSAASAAKAVIDAVSALHFPSKPGSWFVSGVSTHKRPYGLEKDLIVGLPCRGLGEGRYEIISDLEIKTDMADLLKKSIEELQSEREICRQSGLIA
jgi:malate dehydrogenase